MESVRQMIGTIYLALANAAGEGVLEDANTILTDAINSGAVDDLYGTIPYSLTQQFGRGAHRICRPTLRMQGSFSSS
jgi:hypothetical protein